MSISACSILQMMIPKWPEMQETNSYSFGEFCSHLEAMDFVTNYEYVTLRDGETVQCSGNRCFESMVPRVMDYMHQIYSDEREAFYKGARLLMIPNHAASR
jgi:hypothetical protein